MEEKYFDVNGVPTRVLCCGGTAVKEEMTLIIPGNPGMVEFYVGFMESLHAKLGMPVWIICHAGHELPPDNIWQPALKGNGFLYCLSGQVKHKIDFICKYLTDSVKINLIGHSIGCKIILEILKNEKVSCRTKKSVLLFPTVERLAETPNGKFFLKMDKYFHFIIIWFISMLKYLPHFIKTALIRGYSKLAKIPPQFEKTISDLITPVVLEKVFYLAKDEMINVKDLDFDIIKKFLHNIYFYYGSDDKWCPRSYYEGIKWKIPEVKAQLCQFGYRHAFVLSNAIEMAHIVAAWVGTN